MREADSRCLYCKQLITGASKEDPHLHHWTGEWVCEKCNMRGRKLTDEEVKARQGAGKADMGSTENKQYGGSRPIAVGRTGPWPAMMSEIPKPKEPADLLKLRVRINPEDLVSLWGDDE